MIYKGQGSIKRDPKQKLLAELLDNSQFYVICLISDSDNNDAGPSDSHLCQFESYNPVNPLILKILIQTIKRYFPSK